MFIFDSLQSIKSDLSQLTFGEIRHLWQELYQLSSTPLSIKSLPNESHLAQRKSKGDCLAGCPHELIPLILSRTAFSTASKYLN